MGVFLTGTLREKLEFNKFSAPRKPFISANTSFSPKNSCKLIKSFKNGQFKNGEKSCNEMSEDSVNFRNVCALGTKQPEFTKHELFKIVLGNIKTPFLSPRSSTKKAGIFPNQKSFGYTVGDRLTNIIRSKTMFAI
ncbi:hypothetical protein TNCV_629611 [Trichonephila clavipes]|nr:hypothetical protein TNCV_629611 [Trichonephila clavipes]